MNEHITLMNTMTSEVLDIPGVEKKFGIGPDLIVDYLALMGTRRTTFQESRSRPEDGGQVVAGIWFHGRHH